MTARVVLGLLASAALLTAIHAPALATSEPEPDGPIAVEIIEGIEWSLSRQAMDGVLVELPAGVSVSLRLADGHAAGNGGCNDYSAAYQRDGDALVFGPLVATEMYCLETSDVEAGYFADLAGVTGVFSTGGTLVMTGADGEPILEFEVADVAPVPTDGIDDLGCDQAETSALTRTDASSLG